MKVVIKVGTSSLADKNGFLNKKYIEDFVRSIAELKKDGTQIIIVSSGAIGAGAGKLKIRSKPKTLRQKQALAAVGQPIIMNAYSENFEKFGINTAQVLITRTDFDERAKYLNAKNTLSELLRVEVIPIINENDTVAVEEINFGDNDTLGAIVAAAAAADILIIFTDVDGLYAGEPKRSQLIQKVEQITPQIEAFASGKSSSGKGRGGMKTKITAAKIAAASGIETMIINSAKHNLIKEIIRTKTGGTWFCANGRKLDAKKSWIAYGKKPKGIIFVDKKASEAIKNKGVSLLAAGIVGISGNFKAGDTIVIAANEGKQEIGRGLTNFDSTDIETIKGKKTAEIKKLLPG
ncbi:MAG: glutamate 5-kinase, partial [Elusimicrobiota bacterium]|nr:glutamate 5-kinase [Elusimicrobiota bacterium]